MLNLFTLLPERQLGSYIPVQEADRVLTSAQACHYRQQYRKLLDSARSECPAPTPETKQKAQRSAAR